MSASPRLQPWGAVNIANLPSLIGRKVAGRSPDVQFFKDMLDEHKAELARRSGLGGA